MEWRWLCFTLLPCVIWCLSVEIVLPFWMDSIQVLSILRSGLKHILLAFSWEKRQAISCCHRKYFDFHTHFILCLHKCLFLSLIKIPMIFAKAYIDNCYYLVGKEGEDLLHEVASRYVEGMKDMEGRKPGPSSILGKWVMSKEAWPNFRGAVGAWMTEEHC